MGRKKISIDVKMKRLSEEIGEALVDNSLSVIEVKDMLDKYFGTFYLDYKDSYTKLLEIGEMIQKLKDLDDRGCAETGLLNAKPMYMKEFKKCSCCSELISAGELAVEAMADKQFKQKVNSLRKELAKKDREGAYDHRKEISSIAYIRVRKQAELDKIWICEKCSKQLIKDASEITFDNIE